MSSPGCEARRRRVVVVVAVGRWRASRAGRAQSGGAEGAARGRDRSDRSDLRARRLAGALLGGVQRTCPPSS
eukprot:1914681-Prymnesium_polylepis.1